MFGLAAVAGAGAVVAAEKQHQQHRQHQQHQQPACSGEERWMFEIVPSVAEEPRGLGNDPTCNQPTRILPVAGPPLPSFHH
jgi:hypothetical protein